MKSDYIKSSAYNSLYKYMQYENVLVMRLCLETGLRVGDAVKIKLSDISGRTIKYVAEKTGKSGKKVISAALAAELKRNANGGEFVFRGRFDGHRTRQAVWRDIKQACKFANLKFNATPHSARKTYAVNIFHEKGIEATEKELQHDNLSTTMIYAFSDLLSSTQNVQNNTKCVDNNMIFSLVKSAVLAALHEFFENS